MGSKKVVETVYGKHSKFEIVQSSKTFGAKYYVRRNGKVASGNFSSLKAAVEWAENKG